MANNKKDNDISQLSFEQAIKALNEIVNGIEAGKTPLQSSLEQYEKGMALIKHCRKILQAAEKKIDQITSSQNPKDNTEQ